MRLLERKIALVEGRVGSTMLLEAEAGVGKTHLLASFIAHSLPETAAIYYSTASPFEVIKPYAVFSVILRQFLDSKRNPQQPGRDTRTAILLEELESFPKLVPQAYLLNNILQVCATSAI